MNNPCADYLSDKAFLEHMIPHHQMAIDMSHVLMKTTKTPHIKIMARNIAYVQAYEVWEMKMQLQNGLANIGQDLSKDFRRWNPEMKMHFYYPRTSADESATCDPHFFMPMSEKDKREMVITDEEYMKHMIPHHQIAVNMCKRLVRHSKNPYMIELANNIVRGQQYEIWQMRAYLQSKLRFESSLI